MASSTPVTVRGNASHIRFQVTFKGGCLELCWLGGKNDRVFHLVFPGRQPRSWGLPLSHI